VSVRVEVVCVNPDGSEQRREVLAIEVGNWRWKRWA
jgi:hypothetical protein